MSNFGSIHQVAAKNNGNEVGGQGGGEEINYGGRRVSSQVAIEIKLLIANKEACQIEEITIFAQAEQKNKMAISLKLCLRSARSVLPIWRAEQISCFQSAG
jgi:hypothetical protein